MVLAYNLMNRNLLIFEPVGKIFTFLLSAPSFKITTIVLLLTLKNKKSRSEFHCGTHLPKYLKSQHAICFAAKFILTLPKKVDKVKVIV